MTTAQGTVRVRMAPSPTGHWHLGGVRTALFNWLYARQHGGLFLLRIEDTDKARSMREYEIEIIETLKWLNLDWDEGPDWRNENGKWISSSRGECGPYRQSERTEIYRSYLEKLIKENKAYYCYCTREDLEAERQSMLAAGLASKYGGQCREITKPPANKESRVIRFRTPETKVEFNDLIRGSVSFDASLFGDIVIAKNLDSPLYNFAAVVDDELMRISHVLRGEEHISNTSKQILFQHALGFKEPIYGHLPLILAGDRSKLAKRYAEASILKYRQEGYLPEAIINFLGLLGWHPKGDREILTLDELVNEFTLKRIQKAGAIFNSEKLDWLNGQYIKRLTVVELIERLKPFLEEKNIVAPKEFLKKVAEAERDRMKTLQDFFILTDFFFKLPDYDANLLIWKTEPVSIIKIVLRKAFKIIKNIEVGEFERQKLFVSLDNLVNEYGRGAVFWPLRIAVSGKLASPDPLVIMEILGKDETERRIGIATSKIESLIA